MSTFVQIPRLVTLDWILFFIIQTSVSLNKQMKISKIWQIWSKGAILPSVQTKLPNQYKTINTDKIFDVFHHQFDDTLFLSANAIKGNSEDANKFVLIGVIMWNDWLRCLSDPCGWQPNGEIMETELKQRKIVISTWEPINNNDNIQDLLSHLKQAKTPDENISIYTDGWNAFSEKFPLFNRRNLAKREDLFPKKGNSDASKITSNIWLGGDYQDMKQLVEKENVRHVISVNFTDNIAKYPGITSRLVHGFYETEDLGAVMKAVLPKFFKFISTVSPNEGILIHCSAGVNRSPSIVLSYLVGHEKWTLKKAWMTVREKREIINPHVSVLQMLMDLEREVSGTEPWPIKNMLRYHTWPWEIESIFDPDLVEILCKHYSTPS
jgi:protein-tyrosine phosphatase